MQTKIKVDLGPVQRTLFLPLWGRGEETKKQFPLLKDPAALSIIEKVEYDFSPIALHIHPLTQLAWIMRGIYTDRVVGKFLHKYPAGTIVNLGCGLDTSFERNDNGTLTWYEVDLPDVIELRKLFFTESGRRKFIPASVTDEEWIKSIERRENVLFIAAGLLYYLTGDDVKTLFKRIADNFTNCSIICDVSSPLGVEVSNKLVIKNTGLDEKSFLKWGVENKKDITRWDPRFKILKTFFYYRYLKLKLGFKLRFYGFMADRKGIQYMLHLKLND